MSGFLALSMCSVNVKNKGIDRMKKILTVMLLAMSLWIACIPASAAEIEGSVILPAAQASYTRDKGISPENKKAAAKYDSRTGFIWNLAQDAEVTFRVPEGVERSYDIYLNVSKIISQHTSQPFSFRVAGGEVFSVPVDCQVSADALGKYTKDGDEDNIGSLTDCGRFLIQQGASLKAGDEITVICSFGAKSAKLKGVFYPGVGDVLLVPAGTPVGVGYDLALPEQEQLAEGDPLSGKTILWLGSSVTYGAQASGHYSMVDGVEALHPACVCEKYAISATTLVNQSESSYVNRLMLIPKDRQADLLVVQLSTNDATTGQPFGAVSTSFDLQDFDDTTIAGAIETIIAYARETFRCPVVFYTGTYCEKENYGEMVALLHEIEAKWDIGVIDMYNDPEMTAVFGTEQYDRWMGDQVHPRKSGYVQWWTPVIDGYLTEYMSKR